VTPLKKLPLVAILAPLPGLERTAEENCAGEIDLGVRARSKGCAVAADEMVDDMQRGA
jgi:hypothetical protein